MCGPIDGLDSGREAAVRSAYERMRVRVARVGVELWLGFEVTPAAARHAEDPSRFRLGELDAVLMEVPFRGSFDIPVRYAELVESAGLVPILGHPERADAVLAEPSLLNGIHERGWLVQVNGSSLLGHHGRAERQLAWQLVRDGLVDLVASDGHRRSRPPFLDDTFRALERELGASAAALLDGSALTQVPRSPVLAPG